MRTSILFASVALVAVAAFMSDACPVTVIKGVDGGPLRINTEDYDPDVHELYDGPDVDAQPPTALPADPAQPTPVKIVPAKTGRGATARFHAVNEATGEPVTDVAGIDDNGYATEAEAWTAIMAIPAA